MIENQVAASDYPHTRQACAASSRAWLAICAVVAIAAGIVITPERLIAVGLMDMSLQSEIPLVRKSAMIEVLLAKYVLLGLGAGLALAGLLWPRIERHPAYRAFLDRDELRGTPLSFRPDTLPGLTGWCLIGLFSASTAYLLFADRVFDKDTLALIAVEDGIIETLSAAMLLMASALALIVALRPTTPRPRRIMHMVLALLFFAMCGEEISWGQRYLGFDTPEAIKAINVQGETNLHNMSGYFFDHLFILLFFLWGVAVPLLAYASRFFRQVFARIGLPVPSLPLALGMLLITLHQDQIVFRLIDGVFALRLPELRELLSSAAFILLMVESLRLTRAPAQGR